MSTRSQLAEQIKVLENNIKSADALNKLGTNKDFTNVFQDGYCKEYPVQLIKELYKYSPDSTEHQYIIAELEAISRFQSYVNQTIITGQLAKDDLISAKSIPDSELN